jgi:hypothetical protein
MLVMLVVPCFVDKIKNAHGSAKPFHTIIERPDCVGLGQPIHQPPNKMISGARLIFRSVTCFAGKKLSFQTFVSFTLRITMKSVL